MRCLASLAAAMTILLCVVPGSRAVAEEAPAPPKKPPLPPPPPEWPGIRWESDVEAGLARAAREGRPVLVVVNALEDEGATRMLAANAYPTKPWGDATRPYVCFVGNGNTHDQPPGPDGTPACARFRTIPCQGHQDVLTWILRRFSVDGESITSPTHILLEPDGAVAYRKEFYTQEESPPFLDAWATLLSPRLVAKRAWVVREERLNALAKVPVERLEADAKAWLASGDSFAAPALVASLELEPTPRKVALRSALAATPLPQWPALFDEIEAATNEPDGDPESALAWVRVALAVDPDLGAWAAARVVARTKAKAFRDHTIAAWTGDPKKGIDSLPDDARFRAAEALALAGETAFISVVGDSLGKFRASRLGKSIERLSETGDGRVDRWHRLRGIGPAAGSVVHEIRSRRADKNRDVRLAAAVALLRVDDRTAVEEILEALDDPVEGPEVHAALVAWHGTDPGSERASWEEILRTPVATEKPK